jgi:iron complex outermembrane receptor protein
MSFAATAALVLGVSTASAETSAASGSAAADQAQADAPVATGGDSDENTVGQVVVTARLRQESAQTVPEAITAIDARVLKENNITNFYNLQGFAPSVAVNTNYIRDYSTVMVRGFSASAYFNEVPTQPYSLYDLSNVQILYGPQGTLFGYTALGGAVLYTPHHPEMNKWGAGVDVTLGNLHETDLQGYLNVPLVDDKLAVRLAFARNHTDGFTRVQGSGELLDSNDNESVRLGIEWRPTDRLTNYFVATGVRQSNTPTSRVVIAYNPLFQAFQESGTTPTGMPLPGPYPSNFFNYLCTPTILAQVWAPGTTQEQCAAQHMAVLNTFHQQTLDAMSLAKSSGYREIPMPNEDAPMRQLADNVQIQNVTNLELGHWGGFLGGGDISLHNIFSDIWYRNYINNFTVGAFDYYASAFFTPGAQNVFPTPRLTLTPGSTTNPRNAFGDPTLGGWINYYQNEFQVHGTLDTALGSTPGVTWVLGFYDYWASGDPNTKSSTNIPIAFNGAYNANEGPIPCCAAVMDYKSHTYAEYFNATVDMGMFFKPLTGLHVTGGVRYSDNYASRSSAPFLTDYTSANTFIVNTAATSGPVVTETKPLNWSASVDYTTDKNMVYANAAKIVVPGGANAVPLVPADQVPGYSSTYGDAQLQSYEFGDKYHFALANGVRGYINADIYRMEYSRIQIPYTVFVPSTATYFTYTTNPASAIYEGFETQGEILFPEPNIGIYANFAYSHDRYSSYLATDPNGYIRNFSVAPGAVNSPLCVPGASAATVISGTTGTCIMDFKDSPLPYVPKIQATLRLRYTAPLGEMGDLVSSLTASYQSRMYFAAAEPILRERQLLGPIVDQAMSSPAHTTVNARLQWNSPFGHDNLSAAFWVTNLFDKTYAVGAIDTLFAIGIASQDFNPPRQFGITLSASW